MEKQECANSNCNKGFFRKDRRKKYCSLKCKNHASYWNRLMTYEWEIELQKERHQNIKLLEQLLSRRVFSLNVSELRKMGFNFEAAIVPDANDSNQPVYRFGNIYLIQTSETNFQIEPLNIKK